MLDSHNNSVALKSLIDECVATARPACGISPSEVWFTTSKEFRVVADRSRLQAVLLRLLSYGVDDPGYRDVKVWISRSPVIAHGVRLGFRGALPWPKAEQLLESPADSEWMRLEYESESNVHTLRDYGSGLEDETGQEERESSFSVLWMDLELCPESQQVNKDGDGVSATMKDQQGNGFRILYIEDNSANLCLVETALTHRDHVQLLKASTAEEGLEIAMQAQPDLILLDINLPGMDGYEALYQLANHKLTSAIPVIAISANAMGQDVERARKAGARDYLVKPYSINKLFEVIDEWSGYHCQPLRA